MSPLPTLQQFREQLNTTFQAHIAPDRSIGLELVEIKDHGGYRDSNDQTRESFSLFFRGPREVYLPQTIYRLEHPCLGALDLFIVPVGVDQQGMQFEVVIN